MAHRLRKYVGAYAAVLGRLDAVAFTAGIGEHSPELRAAVLTASASSGSSSTRRPTRAATSGEHVISTQASPVTVLVIPTDEELEIAQQAAALVRRP